MLYEDELVFKIYVGIHGLGKYRFEFFVEKKLFEGFDIWKGEYTYLEFSEAREMALDAVNLAREICIDAVLHGKYPPTELPWKYGRIQANLNNMEPYLEKIKHQHRHESH